MIANLEPGLHSLSADLYHSDPCPRPSLSSSIANILITQSPAHAWLAHPRLNPHFKREADSRFDLGSAAHAMLLERDESKIVRADAADWRTKAAKEARDAAAANGQYAILERQYQDVQRMVTAAQSYIATTELRGIFENGVAEQSLVWQEDGVWCRARPDLISADRAIVLDYKTTESAAPADFARQIGRLGYDCQSQWYTRGMAAIDERVTFIFLVQEIEPPYACSLISLANAYKAVGDAKVHRALRLWSDCTLRNAWPGYSWRVLYAEPPVWEVAESEKESIE